MNKKALQLARNFREKPSHSEDNQIIELIYKLSHHNRGKISIVFPDHYEAFTIHFHETDLTVDELKARRESKNVTK